jgi:alpha-tubulin suppressor-like RCC1 family protein
MFSKLRSAFVGLLVIAASTVAVTVSNSPVSAAGAVAPSAVTSSPSIGAQSVPTWSNTNIIAVDTGYEGACAIQGSSPSATSGSLFCWGKAAILGTGANTSSNVPVAVSATDGFTNTAVTAVAVSSEHACAIESGKLWCWGGNYVNGTYGVLGTGGSNSLTPKAVSTSSVAGFDNDGANGDAVISVDATYSFTCAVEGVEVYCWGNNSNSNLGLGANAPGVVNRPMRVLDTATPGFQAASATAVQVGFYHACALASGSAYCWGFNNEGRLGNTTPATGLPTAVATGDFTGSNSNLTAIGLGNYHSCGVQSGKLRCWGEGTYNQLGTGNTSNAATPTNVSAAGSFTNNGLVTSVSGSEKHTCAIQSGVLYCWGKNAEGQLGLGNTTDSSTALPVSASDVPGFLNNGNVTAVSANSGGGYSQTCAIESGTVYCWGASSEGRLGLGTVYGNQSKPVKVFVVSAPAAPTISVSAGQSGSLQWSASRSLPVGRGSYLLNSLKGLHRRKIHVSLEVVLTRRRSDLTAKYNIGTC